MWKVLLAIAAVVLCGAAYLGFENQKSFKSLHENRVDREQEVVEVTGKLVKTEADLKAEGDATGKLVQEVEGLNAKLTVAKGKESDNKDQIEKLTAQVTTSSGTLKKGKEFIKEVPDIEKRKLQMAELQNSIQEEEIATQNVQQQVAEVETRQEKLQAASSELQALVNDQAAGRIRGVFKSTVRKAFNNWGFVIVGAGNEQGVVNRAQLDVTRRGQPICKLLVTTVEPGECVAEVIPGSMAPGQAIQPGDDVTKTELPTPKKPAPAAGRAPVSVPTPALPESTPGKPMGPPAGELLPPAPAPEAGADPVGAPAAPKAPDGGAAKTPEKPGVDSDPFK